MKPPTKQEWKQMGPLQIYNSKNQYVGTIAKGRDAVNIFEPNEHGDSGKKTGTATFSRMFITVHDNDGNLSAGIGKNVMTFPYFIEFHNNSIGKKTIIALMAFDQELQRRNK